VAVGPDVRGHPRPDHHCRRLHVRRGERARLCATVLCTQNPRPRPPPVLSVHQPASRCMCTCWPRRQARRSVCVLVPRAPVRWLAHSAEPAGSEWTCAACRCTRVSCSFALSGPLSFRRMLAFAPPRSHERCGGFVGFSFSRRRTWCKWSAGTCILATRGRDSTKGAQRVRLRVCVCARACMDACLRAPRPRPRAHTHAHTTRTRTHMHTHTHAHAHTDSAHMRHALADEDANACARAHTHTRTRRETRRAVVKRGGYSGAERQG